MKNNRGGSAYIQVGMEWQSTEVYKKINKEINDEWPRWKQEAYNELFAYSTHMNQMDHKD
mgnify:CR=1 FL=1